MSEAKKSAFIALYPVRLDGKTHTPGQALTLTDDQAAPLVAQKIVRAAEAKAPAKPADQTAPADPKKAQGSKA